MGYPSTLIIGSDHAGFELKAFCVSYLQGKGVEVKDVGTYSNDSVDYPDFIHPVASAVEAGEFPLGIVICGSGQGASITANKHQGIRCALCWQPEIARLAKQHNNANILGLAARFTTEHEAQSILDAFFEASFEGGRHERRIGKIPCSV